MILILAAYNSRNCIRQGVCGGIVIAWETMSIGMSVAEFVGLAGMLAVAETSRVRSGELSRCESGRVCRQKMGQYEVGHRGLTLWFSAEEYEEFRWLIRSARERLADAEPPSPLGSAWTPEGQSICPN
ncbi:MAG: hypothetical protein ACR2KW_06735 [Rubrobacter sp.]